MIKKIIFVLLMLITFVSCNYQVSEKKTTSNNLNGNEYLNLGENETEHYIFYVFRNPAKDYINRKYIILAFKKKSSGQVYPVDIYHSNSLIISEIENSNKSLFNSTTDKGKSIETYENNKLVRSIDQNFSIWVEYSQPYDHNKYSTTSTMDELVSNDYGRIGGNYYDGIDGIKSEYFKRLSYYIRSIKDYSYYTDEITGKEVSEVVEYYDRFDLDLELN